MSPKLSSSLLLLVCLVLPLAAACAAPPAEAQAEAEKEGKTDTAVAAVVGEKTITMAELRDEAASQLVALRNQEYEALRATLDRMIADALLESEAARRGTDPESMLRAEIETKTGTVSDTEIDAFYEQNKARINQPKEAVVEQIRQTILRNRQAQLFQGFLGQLRSEAGVTVSLEAPRFEVATDGDPAFGPEAAPVTIVEFSDFQCPYCARVVPTLKQIREKYGDKVRVVFRDYPLEFHREARKAAEAAHCADEQDRFWDYHDALFQNQEALQVADLKARASSLGLDAAAFDACLDSGKYAEEVQSDFQDGARVGVTGTPAFFINGRFVNGAQPFELFAQIIDEELAKGSGS